MVLPQFKIDLGNFRTWNGRLHHAWCIRVQVHGFSNMCASDKTHLLTHAGIKVLKTLLRNAKAGLWRMTMLTKDWQNYICCCKWQGGIKIFKIKIKRFPKGKKRMGRNISQVSTRKYCIIKYNCINLFALQITPNLLDMWLGHTCCSSSCVVWAVKKPDWKKEPSV